jgi:hypothetical protein
MPKLSPTDVAKIMEMEAYAWRSITTWASVVEGSTMKLRDTNTQCLLNEINKYKKLISNYIDKCKDFYE